MSTLTSPLPQTPIQRLQATIKHLCEICGSRRAKDLAGKIAGLSHEDIVSLLAAWLGKTELPPKGTKRIEGREEYGDVLLADVIHCYLLAVFQTAGRYLFQERTRRVLGLSWDNFEEEYLSQAAAWLGPKDIVTAVQAIARNLEANDPKAPLPHQVEKYLDKARNQALESLGLALEGSICHLSGSVVQTLADLTFRVLFERHGRQHPPQFNLMVWSDWLGLKASRDRVWRVEDEDGLAIARAKEEAVEGAYGRVIIPANLGPGSYALIGSNRRVKFELPGDFHDGSICAGGVTIQII